MVIVLFILLLILIVCMVLVLPLELSSRLNLIIVSTGVMITGYALYRAIRNENTALVERIKDNHDKYYTSIYEMFSSDKELEDMYYEIYGRYDVSPKEFSIFSVMIQAIQNVAMSYNYIDIPSYWFNTWRKWISHHEFGTYWSMSRDEFSPNTVKLIDSISLSQYVNGSRPSYPIGQSS